MKKNPAARSGHSGKLIILSAPSGAGKTTLCRRLLQEYPDRLVLSISSTTRPPRGSERDGVEYHFLSRDEFERRIASGGFAEWAEVHGHYYGTSKDTIRQALDRGVSVLLDIDVQGADSLREAFPGQVYSIFVRTPDFAELEKRLRDRGTDSEEAILRRIVNARKEMEREPEFDYVLVNDDIERAYTELRRVVAPILGVKPQGKGDFGGQAP